VLLAQAPCLLNSKKDILQILNGLFHYHLENHTKCGHCPRADYLNTTQLFSSCLRNTWLKKKHLRFFLSQIHFHLIIKILCWQATLSALRNPNPSCARKLSYKILQSVCKMNEKMYLFFFLHDYILCWTFRIFALETLYEFMTRCVCFR